MALCSSFCPISTVDFVQRSAEDLFADILSYLKCRVVEVIKNINGTTDNEEVHNIIGDFEGWKKPFKEIDRQYRLLAYLKKKNVYIEPEAHRIGKRWEMRYDRKEKKSQIDVDNIHVFYYVFIKATLRLVLRSKDSQNLLKSQLTSNQKVLEYWVDDAYGIELLQYSIQHFPQSKPIFIQIYFEEVETVNPLGSKTGLHKIGAFYFVLKNLPPLINSSLHNIHLLLWHTLKILRNKRASLS